MDYENVYDMEKYIIGLGYEPVGPSAKLARLGFCSYKRGNYKVSLYRSNRTTPTGISGISFAYINSKYIKYLLSNNVVVATILVDDIREVLEIISRIDIREMSKYPPEKMEVILYNIMNEKVIDRL